MTETTSQSTGTSNLHGSAIRRDAFGIPHIAAETESDAWFAMGFATAQDRLWQMEYDRRRAVGRWAEVVGPSALGADTLARKLRLDGASRQDVRAMTPETVAAFEAYAAGVNAYLDSGVELPPEYELTGITPERWEPWHSVASFKIRHILMGSWQLKLAQAILLTRVGPDTYQALDSRGPRGSVKTMPPASRIEHLFEHAREELESAAAELGFLSEVEAGSNAWVVHGSRTATGMPVLCNDSHRALDVPNVYWQAHVSCPAFDVIGATFPGLPGFPHFGHNGKVGWAITHGNADYQDLYIERFDPDDPTRYLTPDGWQEADRRVETIAVRGEAPREIETWATRHGPVVHGNPRSGHALSLRYTATDKACRGFEVLRPMLQAGNVEGLLETQRLWVDPVNNLLAADTSGNIGYLTRGMVPIRSNPDHRQFPVPGWTGEHEWVGMIPFERMPRSVNPPEGFVASANQTIVEPDGIYISDARADPFRAERIVEVLSGGEHMTPGELGALQGDVTSVAARLWLGLLRALDPLDGDAERARQHLIAWDGVLLPDSSPALLYACFRRELPRALFEPMTGPDTWEWLASASLPSTSTLIRRWLTGLLWNAAHNRDEGAAERLRQAFPTALSRAWADAVTIGGDDPTRWRWASHHHTAAKHTLDATFPDLASELDPPTVELGGDSDCIQAASYTYQLGERFDITGLSVYRQVVDLSDIASASYVIPGGSSANPWSPHYSDQLELWRTHQRIPMYYRPGDVEAAAVDVAALPSDNR